MINKIIEAAKIVKTFVFGVLLYAAGIAVLAGVQLLIGSFDK